MPQNFNGGQEVNDAAPEVAPEVPENNAGNQDQEEPAPEVREPDVIPLNEYSEADKLALKDLI